MRGDVSDIITVASSQVYVCMYVNMFDTYHDDVCILTSDLRLSSIDNYYAAVFQQQLSLSGSNSATNHQK